MKINKPFAVMLSAALSLGVGASGAAFAKPTCASCSVQYQHCLQSGGFPVFCFTQLDRCLSNCSPP